jgi:hypothetical protein
MWNTFKVVLGIGMMVIGSLVALVGIGMALFTLFGLYSSNLDNALGNEVDAMQVRDGMLFWAILGLVGAVVGTFGSFVAGLGLVRMFKRAIFGGK